METIRALRREDVPSVAQLFQKIFRHTLSPAPRSLIVYFEEIYLDNPWRDDKINSLVYESDGHILGFLGAIPFPMILNGKPIQAVIGGNYMIDRDHPNPLAGIRILKTLFSGPQDLTFSDTATETARLIWEGMGSETIQLYSLQWLKIFRPVQFAISMETKKTMLSPIASILKPFSFAIDSFLGTIPHTPFYARKTPLHQKQLTTSELLAAIQHSSSRKTLGPDYSLRTLEWIVAKAEEKKEFGPLRKMALLDTKRILRGWYLYYPNSGKLGQVLQIGADQKSISSVLINLFSDAKKAGSLALAGRLEPGFAHAFSSHQSFFTHRNSSFVVHSANDTVLRALHRGDAFLSRLEGEWWTRLQGDKFSIPQHLE